MNATAHGIEVGKISRTLYLGVLATLFCCFASFAADNRQVPVVGEIFFSVPSTAEPWDRAFRDALKALGYVEGKNIQIETRYASGNPSRVRAIVDELLGLPVDVLYVSPRVLDAAMKATKTVPIVCPEIGNPIRDRVVASIARPGGNVTGGYSLSSEMDPKRLELILEAVPNATRIAILYDVNDPSVTADATVLGRLIAGRKLTPQLLGVRNLQEIEAALQRIQRDRPHVLVILDTALVEFHQQLIIRSTRHRLPVISEGRDWAKDGALLTYGPNSYDMWRRSASHVDRILKGARPGDIPIEQANKFELIVNLRTADVLGIAIPESILVRADEIVR